MKRILCLILALAVILCGCGQAAPAPTPTPEPTPEPFDLAEYKQSAVQIVDAIDTAEPSLSTILNYEMSYAKNAQSISGKVNYDAMLEAAVAYTTERGIDWDVIADQYDSIRSLYLEFIAVDTQGDKLGGEIEENIKLLFEAYITMYSYATDPNADLTSLAQAGKNYPAAMSMLDVLLSN